MAQGSHKKNWEKAVRLTAWGGRGSPPSSLTASICESFDPFFSFMKWQNNPIYDNLTRNFYRFGGGGGGVSLTTFPPFFTPSLR